MSNTTLYDIVTRNHNDALTGLVEDVTIYAPEFSQIPVIVRAGTTYKTLARVALPSAGFRQLNQGITGSKSVYKQMVHEMFPIDTQIVIDELAYKADDGVTGDILYQEGQGALQSVINLIGKQTYYGVANDGSNGFVGLQQQLLSTLATNPTATPVTASTSATSSTAYGLWLHPQGVAYSVGKQGEIAFPPFQRQLVPAPNGSGNIFAWVSNISTFIGLSVASNNAVFGITGITQAAPLTDKLGADLLVNVPLTRRAGFTFFMNRLAQASLQKSRSAINYQPASAKSGTPAWSPPPLELEGYPIVVTDSITNTEDNR
jgi:hypothetical protein